MLLRETWEGDVYRERHIHNNGTVQEGPQVLAVHLHLDDNVLSSSGDVSADPLRMLVKGIQG